MDHCQFYLISSKKSEEDLNGLKKISFGCVNRANSFGFIWIDDKNNIKHIQFIFGETVLEWSSEKGLRYSITNRERETPEGTGIQKGVRILHPIDNKGEIKDEILDVIEEARNALYPKEWSEKILEKI